jgi:hypothetical protein
MTPTIMNEFVETVNGVVQQIKGGVPEIDDDSYSATNKTSDEIQPGISVRNMSPWNTAIGLGYMTGPVFEGTDKEIKENVIDKHRVSALDLLSIDEDAPSADEDDESEYVDRSKKFTQLFNDFFDEEEKVKSLNILFDRLHIYDIDSKYKKSLLNKFRDKLFN